MESNLDEAHVLSHAHHHLLDLELRQLRRWITLTIHLGLPLGDVVMVVVDLRSELSRRLTVGRYGQRAGPRLIACVVARPGIPSLSWGVDGEAACDVVRLVASGHLEEVYGRGLHETPVLVVDELGGVGFTLMVIQPIGLEPS